ASGARDLLAGPAILSHRACTRRRFALEVAAKGIDVDAAAGHEARIDGQRLRSTALQDVDEHSLDAVLVERRMAAIRNEIPQQPRAVDAASPIPNHDVAAVGLTGHRALR